MNWMRPSRVLMTADCVGGVWTYVVDLIAGLSRYGIDVGLFVMGGPLTKSQWQTLARLPNVNARVTTYRLEWMECCEHDLIRSGVELMKFYEEYRPDLVHVNGYWHATLGFECPVIVVAHSCVSSWWRACKGTQLPTEWTSYSHSVSAGVDRAELVVAPSNAFLHEFCGLYGRPKACRVIYNGREPVTQQPAKKKRPFVLCAGRIWDEAKNVGLLAEALSGTDIPVIVAGKSTSPSGVSTSFDSVLEVGELSASDMAMCMNEAAIFASPARYEPFGLAVLEAALQGCALVLSDIPSFKELWHGAATFVPANDGTAWRDTIVCLMTDVDQCEALGMRARARASGFTVEEMTSNYLRAYSSVLCSAEASA